MIDTIPSRKRIAILGLGDLGKRVMFGLAANKLNAEIFLASRNLESVNQTAALASACHGRRVRAYYVDGTNEASILHFLKSTRPDILVQCASIVSPWAAFEKSNPELVSFRAAGFAANLSAQLPIIMNVMRVIDKIDMDCTVINCSYPDVTNPVLHAIGLTPDIGIGNVGMIRRLIEVMFDFPASELKIFAHHSQVWPFLSGKNGLLTPPVRVFLGDLEVSEKIGTPVSNISVSKNLNALAAAHALDVVLGYLKENEETITSAPGINGLPGGWPIRIASGKASLDLPAGISLEEMISYQGKVATREGIQEISKDGTVFFTNQLYDALPDSYKALGEPLEPDRALERSNLLSKLMALE